MKILLLLLVTTSTLLGCYLPPAEEVAVFRRDTLPLDSNRQILLSQDLLALATRPTAMVTAADRRATSQLIALASTLDPNSKAPANLNQSYSNQSEDSAIFANSETEGALNNISQIATFLLKKPTNPQNQKLAQLLLDPLIVIAPDRDIISARPHAKESPRWRQIVPPLTKFEQPAPPIATNPEKEKPSVTPSPEPTLEKPNHQPDLPQIAPFDGSILTPCFLGKTTKVTTLCSLQFKGSLTPEPSQITSPFLSKNKFRNKITETVNDNLAKRHSQKIIAHTQGLFELKGQDFHEHNRLNIALPMAILAEGLLSEQQPLQDLTVFGILTENGTIKAPRNAAQFMETLPLERGRKPRRLLVSPKLRPLLESFIVLHQEDFFFAYDVFEVSTLDEALTLSFEGSEPEHIKEAIAQFEEIRRVGSGKETSIFVSNPHVMKRLINVCSLEERFLSASFLKMRGDNKQPSKHSSQALTSFIENALSPLSQLFKINAKNLETATLEKIHRECRQKLDPLEKDVALRDLDLYREALDLTNRVRTLARLKTRTEKDEFNYSTNTLKMQNSLHTIKEGYLQLQSKIEKILHQTPLPSPTSEDQNPIQK